ncbi:hypothetical protein ACHAWC_002937 [Mediolabrus comicus]
MLTPTPNDVLSGRGHSVNNHPGNEAFRRMLESHMAAYSAGTKKQKMMISRTIVDDIYSKEPPGRFLKECPDTRQWIELSRREAADKAAQAMAYTVRNANSAKRASKKKRKALSSPSTTAAATKKQEGTVKIISSSTQRTDQSLPSHANVGYPGGSVAAMMSASSAITASTNNPPSPSISSLQQQIPSLGYILELITRKDWESFRSNVLSSPAVFRNLAGAVEACSALNGMTLLHAIARCSPPLDIVAQMVAICPYMPSSKDCLDRTPLHVAAGSKASASLIELLARANPAACDVQDEEGNTPLHFACDSSCVLFEEDIFNEGSPRQPPNHEAVAALLSYSFHAAILKDDVNMIPLDHAIRSNASSSTVKLLRSAMQRGNQLNEGIQSFITATKNMQVTKHDEFMSSLSINSRPTKKVRRTPLVHTLPTQAARSA